MRHYIVSPVIGGLVAIIVVGLFMHDGASTFSRHGVVYQSGYQPSNCNFAVSTDSLSPTLVAAAIRSGVHC